MARAAQRNGADVRLTIDPDVHHEAWEKSLRQRRYVGMAAGAEKERIKRQNAARRIFAAARRSNFKLHGVC